jgi:phosphatidylglycerophosphate synthase
MLTGLGIFGAVLGSLGFALGLTSDLSLILVFIGFTLNWLGDSLDGKIARHRRIERKVQGFILDNGVDLVSYLLLALGFAASGLVSLPIPFLLLSLYMLLSNLALARLLITGVHDLAIDSIGTTELRVAFLALAVLLYLFPDFFRAVIPLLDMAVLDFLSLFWACVMLLNFVLVLRRDIHLAREADEG